MKVALLTAGKDPHYALGLGPALAVEGIEVDFVGNDEMQRSGLLEHPCIRFYNLRGDQSSQASAAQKVIRVLRYYARLLAFSARTDAPILHILWPNRFVHLDRTVLNLYYRILGKKLVFTAHNINTEARDRVDSALNRLTLKVQYRLMSHVFVHTKEMKAALQSEYGLDSARVTVLRFPINNVTPRSTLTRAEARRRLGLSATEKVLLFFGNIASYKGLEDVIRALPRLAGALEPFTLLLVGDVKKGEEAYFRSVQQLISRLGVSDRIQQQIEYVPEEDVETYFKAADLALLPYRRIYQSGVLFLAYSFGLPVVASAVGGLPEEMVEGETGYLCRPGDPEDLAAAIIRYFESPLFLELEKGQEEIRKYAERTYSWKAVGEAVSRVYHELDR